MEFGTMLLEMGTSGHRLVHISEQEKVCIFIKEESTQPSSATVIVNSCSQPGLGGGGACGSATNYPITGSGGGGGIPPIAVHRDK